MASLQLEKHGQYHIVFRLCGKRFKRSLNTKSETKAVARKECIEETLALVKNGRLCIPDGVDPAEFILSDGKVSPPANTAPNEKGDPEPVAITLQELLSQFFNSIPDGNLEETTLAGMHIHEGHLLRVLGRRFATADLTLKDLQKYVNKRSKESTQFHVDQDSRRSGRTKVTATTIRKELVTLATAWRWATAVSLVSGPFPRRGLRFPKTQDKPPFQTWTEIERQISQTGINGRAAAMLWDALYLRRTEIDELLEYVRTTAPYPFIYPMFVMAAHTGARRSEILRAQRADFDFDSEMITIQERKRVRGKLTTRRVPMSPMLRAAILKWFQKHPGGRAAFCHSVAIHRSRSRTPPAQPITRDQAHDHFQRTLTNSKWQKVRGWHCFRHSFISNMACKGIDQRIIDELVGHTTEEMRRRYRHLFPDVKHNAIREVFA